LKLLQRYVFNQKERFLPGHFPEDRVVGKGVASFSALSLSVRDPLVEVARGNVFGFTIRGLKTCRIKLVLKTGLSTMTELKICIP
jgi:hypothetical protein